MRKIPAISCVAFAAAAMLTAASASKPNFSGEWRMVPGKSNFGVLPAPAKYDRKIDHKEPLIQMTTWQTGPKGEQRLDLTLRTDGEPTTNHYQTGDATTVGNWTGDKLNFETTRQTPAGTITTQDHWFLSSDGSTLTTETHLNTPQGAFDFRVVFERR